MVHLKNKEEQIKIAVNTFNWGPCVTRFKIQDDFRKVLLDEAKKSEEENQQTTEDLPYISIVTPTYNRKKLFIVKGI